MRTIPRRVCARIIIAAGLVSVAAIVPTAQTFDGEPDPQPARADLAIVGGLLIDGHEGPPLPGAIVLVDGDRIVAVGSRDTLTVPEGAEVVDATGFDLLIDGEVPETTPPSAEKVRLIREAIDPDGMRKREFRRS